VEPSERRSDTTQSPRPIMSYTRYTVYGGLSRCSLFTHTVHTYPIHPPHLDTPDPQQPVEMSTHTRICVPCSSNIHLCGTVGRRRAWSSLPPVRVASCHTRIESRRQPPHSYLAKSLFALFIILTFLNSLISSSSALSTMSMLRFLWLSALKVGPNSLRSTMCRCSELTEQCG
jgi:hypothetical protein